MVEYFIRAKMGKWFQNGFVHKKLEALNSAASVSNDQLEVSKEQLLKELWNQRNLEFDQWSAQARSKLDSYEKDFVSESPNPAEWSLADSWLFACTIFTTIGYGNIVPVSMCGRIFCILYAFIGIPLFTVVAANLASLITGVLQLLHSANLRRKRQREAGKQKKDEDSSELHSIEDNPDQEFHLTLMNVLSLAAAYLAAGAVLFSLWEEWSLFESFYYCFVTFNYNRSRRLCASEYAPHGVLWRVHYCGSRPGYHVI
ncbi:stabilization of membrane putative [Desmophyllum pertusum]|uniref:Stabilization of membrane putative n=1 Tax=Desmophyllum pertusum TaxID=174260 RepID=A0A9W9YLE6_9CNID|nr:stabilization of membrane putative [Desmophyllum pertusum]